MKRLYRSKTDQMLAGVCGGLGEYFNIDPTLIRLAYTFLTVLTGVVPGSFVYIVAALIIPEAPNAPKKNK